MRVFVDASAWIPLVVPRDQHATTLRRVLADIRSPNLITTNWTLYEALAVTRRRRPGAEQLLIQGVLRQATVIPVETTIEAEALRRFLEWRDKGASVVDHANLLVSLRERCEAVISFDADFAPLAAAVPIRLIP